MPVLIYITAVVLTVIASALGLTVVAVFAAVVAAGLVFRTELRQIKLPSVDFRRTDP